MSKFNPSMFNVAAFPTFRLYSEPKKFIEFTEKEFDIKTLRKWLKEAKVPNVEEEKEPEKKPEVPKKK